MNIPRVALDYAKSGICRATKRETVSRGCNIAKSIEAEQESSLGVNSYLVACIVRAIPDKRVVSIVFFSSIPSVFLCNMYKGIIFLTNRSTGS